MESARDGSPGRERLHWRTFLPVSVSAMLVSISVVLITNLGAPGARMRHPSGSEVSDASAAVIGLFAWLWGAAALAVPGLFLLAWRFPFDRRRGLLSAGLHVLTVGALAYLTAAAYYSVRAGSFLTPSIISGQLLIWSLPLCVVVGLVQGSIARQHTRDRKLETAHLRGQLAEVRLESLAARLQPHFLFNTLQGISTLLHRDPQAADRMLGRLSELLRMSLQGGSRSRHSLREELVLLDHYMGICMERFGDRLDYRVEVADAARDALVPFFVLQPLAENAIEHGIARRAGVGVVTVFAHVSGVDLILGVDDDGPGLEQTKGEGGLGLGSTRARLAESYGDQAHFKLVPNDPRGTRACIRIPLET